MIHLIVIFIAYSFLDNSFFQRPQGLDLCQHIFITVGYGNPEVNCENVPQKTSKQKVFSIGIG